VKRNCRYLFLLSLLLLICIPYAAAQGSATVAIGFGSARAKASESGIVYFPSIDDYRSCTPIFAVIPDPRNSNVSPVCMSRPSLDGFFLGFGGDALPWNHFGFGFNVSLLPSKRTYYDLKYRQTFYEFNGIYAPINVKRAVLKLMGGIGGAKTSFSYQLSGVTSSQSQSYGSQNHFQLHAGAGVDLYVTKNAFVRPQIDFHYIPNFTDQFGSNMVPSAMIWIGAGTGGK
jgi:hypothetical protein